MTNGLLLLQVALLAVIIYLLRHRDTEQIKMEQALFLKALDAVANGYKRPVPQDPGVWETLTRGPSGEWNHHGFVRENTLAWHHAFNAPGYALRHEAGGPIEEGIQ